MELIDRARAYVAKMPPAISGSGGHDATFHVACVLLQGFSLSAQDAWTVMKEYNLRCDPQWSDKELEHKLRGADKAVPKRGRGFLAQANTNSPDDFRPARSWKEYHSVTDAQQKAVFDAEALRKFSGAWAREVDLVWLANRSRLDPAEVSSGAFLQALYEPGEKVAVFTGEHAATIGRGVEMWPDVEPPPHGPVPKCCGVWFLAQPVDGQYHPTDDKDADGKLKMSCRNYRAVTAWRYLVIESDKADTRQWLGAIAQLPLKISAMYSSGGRSVHALVRVDARTKQEWDMEKDKIARAIVTLGADKKTLSAVRLTRLPGCVRHGKMIDDPEGRKSDRTGKVLKVYDRFAAPKLQKLLYINPRPDPCPLIDYFARRDVVKEWCNRAAAGVADSDETGGAWIARGLDYYAGQSAECAAALREFREENL